MVQEVHITLPFLGVPASAVEIELQKSESIQLDGQDATVTEEKLDEMVLWTGSRSSNMYSVSNLSLDCWESIIDRFTETVSVFDRNTRKPTTYCHS